MEIKKLNFKKPKYIIPLIALPFVIIFGYQGSKLMAKDRNAKTKVKTEDISTFLGDTKDSIMTKNDAYNAKYQKGDGRTMLEGLDKEKDSLATYTDNLTIKQKRFVDSIKASKEFDSHNKGRNPGTEIYYKKPFNNTAKTNSNTDLKRGEDIINMLNNGSEGNKNPSRSSQNQNLPTAKNEENDPVKMMRKQLFMMDSLQKSNDPTYQSEQVALKKLKKNKQKMKAFLNSTLIANKSTLNPSFNSISLKNEDKFIKAVIDENTKGYLGSRIRLRLLEDITVGNRIIPKGTELYAQISGFDLQRVKLNVYSLINNGEILPINLTVFDIDGMQGLYVPQSDFREMLRELGTNSVQGTQMNSGGEGFFTSLLGKAFSSTSQTIANLIRKNKVKLKFNSYIYLINEKELKKNENI